MTWQKNLVRKSLDSMYDASVSRHFARYALSLKYQLLPEEVAHQAKRSLLDSLGCAIGAYEAPGRPICEEVVMELGGKEEATLFGSGHRTTALLATLVNSFLVRYLDYSDVGGGSHGSDAIAGTVAVAEREKSSGKNFLTAVVITYELGTRVREAIVGSIEEKGWNADIRSGLNMPPALGTLMGLNEAQIANAIGVCASHCLPLGILDCHREENEMAKNLRFGLGAYDAILACLLARKGFTGPMRVFEGDKGLCHTVLQGAIDMERLLDFSGWRILNVRHKCLCCNATTIAHVLATLAIVRENDLRPADIRAVRIGTVQREWLHTATLAKKYPYNGETADHSAFYANAVAIKERHFGPDSFKPEKFDDPVVLDLIEKITVEYDPSLPTYNMNNMPRMAPGKSEIITKDGRRFQKHIEMPHGFGDDPLTDKELEQKFSEMAVKHMPERQIKNIFDTVWNLEKLKDLNELTRLMVYPQKG
jgi:2-methylcitrate dehydratase